MASKAKIEKFGPANKNAMKDAAHRTRTGQRKSRTRVKAHTNHHKHR